MIQATVWAGIYKSFGFELEEGMKINVIGRIQLYEPSGSYSIVIEKAEPDGVGALAIQFEQLKKKLTEEGLFQDRWKQALPQFPRKSFFRVGTGQCAISGAGRLIKGPLRESAPVSQHDILSLQVLLQLPLLSQISSF